MYSNVKSFLTAGLLILMGGNILIFTGALLKLQHNPNSEFWLATGLILSIGSTSVAIKDLFTQNVDANIRKIWLMSFFIIPLAQFIYFIKRVVEEKRLQFEKGL